MSLPTSTRAELRRAIAGELSMPFFRRYPSYLTFDTGSSTDGTYVVDSDLAQPDGYWNNMWLYISANVSTATGATLDDNVGSVRLIDQFDNKENKLFLEYALPQGATNKDRYEIHENWNANEIHNAINRAIRDGFPDFFNTVEDKTLVLKEDTLEYDISALTNRPWVISEVYIERPYDSITGTATSGAATSLTDTSADFSDATTSHYISIYDGTGTGQLRACTTGTSAGVINIGVAWTTNPDSTSKYRFWDSREQRDRWYRVTSAHFDKLEYPSVLYLSKLYYGDYGARIKLVYATDALEMDDDADTTTVPKEFVIYKAIEFLASSRVSNTKADRERFAVLEQTYSAKAEIYRQKHANRMDTTMWQESDPTSPSAIPSDGDPLGWLG
jgi:hypothetical protein